MASWRGASATWRLRLSRRCAFACLIATDQAVVTASRRGLDGWRVSASARQVHARRLGGAPVALSRLRAAERGVPALEDAQKREPRGLPTASASRALARRSGCRRSRRASLRPCDSRAQPGARTPVAEACSTARRGPDAADGRSTPYHTADPSGLAQQPPVAGDRGQSLSAGSSDSLPPQDRWKTSLPRTEHDGAATAAISVPGGGDGSTIPITVVGSPP